jgi:hypothetical protein
VEFQVKRISLARGNRREFKTIAAILTSAYASLSIEELTEKFPRFRVAFLLAELLAIQPERSPRLEREIAAAEDECRRRWAGMELSAIPEVAAWRAAYKGFGIRRTSYRSSAERLIKRVLAGEPLPRINALVDLYNMVWASNQPLSRLRRFRQNLWRSRLPLREGRRQLRRNGRGSRRGPERSAEGGRGGLCGRPPRALPAVELAPGRAHRLEPLLPAARY